MSCCLCSGDYKPHTNRSDFKFMEELFSDFTDSDNLCVSCFARLDNLIDYANTDLTTEATRPNINESAYTYAHLTTEGTRPNLIENTYTDLSTEIPRPKKFKIIKQANNKLQKIQPKKEIKLTLQGGFRICKLSAEQLSQLTSTNFGHLKNHMGIQTIDRSLLTNLNNLQFIQVTEGHMNETIQHALQRSMISNI